MLRHFEECIGAILDNVETKSAISTVGPPENKSEISSALASKKHAKKKRIGSSSV